MLLYKQKNEHYFQKHLSDIKRKAQHYCFYLSAYTLNSASFPWIRMSSGTARNPETQKNSLKELGMFSLEKWKGFPNMCVSVVWGECTLLFYGTRKELARNKYWFNVKGNLLTPRVVQEIDVTVSTHRLSDKGIWPTSGVLPEWLRKHLPALFPQCQELMSLPGGWEKWGHANRTGCALLDSALGAEVGVNWTLLDGHPFSLCLPLVSIFLMANWEAFRAPPGTEVTVSCSS